MADAENAVVQELRLMREQQRLLGEQQWTMHHALVGRIDNLERTTDRHFLVVEQRLENVEHRLESVEHRVESVEVRLGSVENRVEKLEHGLDHLGERLEGFAQAVTQGFAQVVAHGNRLQSAFDRFVELSLEERRRVLEVKVH